MLPVNCGNAGLVISQYTLPRLVSRKRVAPSVQVMSTFSTRGVPDPAFFHTKVVPLPSTTRLRSERLTAGAFSSSTNGFMGA